MTKKIPEMKSLVRELKQKGEKLDKEVAEAAQRKEVIDVYQKDINPRTIEFLSRSSPERITTWSELSNVLEEAQELLRKVEKAFRRPLILKLCESFRRFFQALNTPKAEEAINWVERCLEEEVDSEKIKEISEDLDNKALPKAEKLKEKPKEHLRIGVATDIAGRANIVPSPTNLYSWIRVLLSVLSTVYASQETLNNLMVKWEKESTSSLVFSAIVKALKTIQEEKEKKDFDEGADLSQIALFWKQINEDAAQFLRDSDPLLTSLKTWVQSLPHRATILSGYIEAMTPNLKSFQMLGEKLKELNQKLSGIFRAEGICDVEVIPGQPSSFEATFVDLIEAVRAFKEANTWKEYENFASILEEEFKKAKEYIKKQLEDSSERYVRVSHLEGIERPYNELSSLKASVSALDRISSLKDCWIRFEKAINELKEALKEHLTPIARELLDLIEDFKRQSKVRLLEEIFSQMDSKRVTRSDALQAIIELEQKGVYKIRFE